MLIHAPEIQLDSSYSPSHCLGPKTAYVWLLWKWKIIAFVQSLSHVRLFATPYTAAHQASLSFAISQSLLKLMSIELVMPSIQPSHPLSSPSPPALNLPASGSFPMSQLFESGGQSIGPSASASVLPMNIQGWFPLILTGSISLLNDEVDEFFSLIQIFGLWSFLHSVI